jgi:hypothetical protein
MKEGEVARFCDLLHLLKRSLNTLKEVGRENDMNNNNDMLAITEQRCMRMIAKYGHATWKVARVRLHWRHKTLILWMTCEMKSRVRATAPVRSS